VIPGAGVDGSARVEIVWADGAIQKQWLRIEVLANANTGLQAPDIFYYGNAIGETGNSATDAIVNATDQVLTRSNSSSFRQVEVTNRYDFNKDGLVNITDVLISRANSSGFTPLKLIRAP
jgi:endoglucanase